MTGREAAAEALAEVALDFIVREVGEPLPGMGLQAHEFAARVLAAIERGEVPGVGVLPESETLRQVADELADWTFPDPDETQPHSAYRVALLERLHRYVGLLRSRADLAADREPDGLRAKAQAWDEGFDAGWAAQDPDDHAPNPYRALLAHPATDQEEWKPRTGTVEDDLRSRLGCVMEATYWDRPYEERIAAIQGMCDLTTDGMTAADQEEADRG